VLNRQGSLGPAPGRTLARRTRAGSPRPRRCGRGRRGAVALDPQAYRTFNLIVADERDGFWLRHAAADASIRIRLKDGLSIIASGDVDDLWTRRLELHFAGVSEWPAAGPRSR